MFKSFAVLAFAAVASAQQDLKFTSEGQFKVKNAAFLNMSKF